MLPEIGLVGKDDQVAQDSKRQVRKTDPRQWKVPLHCLYEV